MKKKPELSRNGIGVAEVLIGALISGIVIMAVNSGIIRSNKEQRRVTDLTDIGSMVTGLQLALASDACTASLPTAATDKSFAVGVPGAFKMTMGKGIFSSATGGVRLRDTDSSFYMSPGDTGNIVVDPFIVETLSAAGPNSYMALLTLEATPKNTKQKVTRHIPVRLETKTVGSTETIMSCSAAGVSGPQVCAALNGIWLPGRQTCAFNRVDILPNDVAPAAAEAILNTAEGAGKAGPQQLYMHSKLCGGAGDCVGDWGSSGQGGDIWVDGGFDGLFRLYNKNNNKPTGSNAPATTLSFGNFAGGRDGFAVSPFVARRDNSDADENEAGVIVNVPTDGVLQPASPQLDYPHANLEVRGRYGIMTSSDVAWVGKVGMGVPNGELWFDGGTDKMAALSMIGPDTGTLPHHGIYINVMPVIDAYGRPQIGGGSHSLADFALSGLVIINAGVPFTYTGNATQEASTLWVRADGTRTGNLMVDGDIFHHGAVSVAWNNKDWHRSQDLDQLNAMNVLRLSPKEIHSKDSFGKELVSYGFTPEDLEKNLPAAITTDSTGTKIVHESDYFAWIVAALKGVWERVTLHDSQIAELKNELKQEREARLQSERQLADLKSQIEQIRQIAAKGAAVQKPAAR